MRAARNLISTFAVFAILAAPVSAQPLPNGAVVRLGSDRFLHGDWIHSLAFTPDGKSVMTGTGERFARLWDTATGRELRSFPTNSSVMRAALSPDGKTVAVAENGPIIYLWETTTGKELRRLVGAKERTFALAWSPDGKTLASGDSKSVILWDAVTGAISRRLETAEEYTSALAFSPDGAVLATAGGRETMRLWDAANGTVLRILEGKTGFQACLTFSPDGKSLAGSCETQTGPGSHRSSMRVWDPATGMTLRDLPGSFNCVAFSPDGKLMTVGGLEDARVLDAVTAKELRRLPRYHQHVTRMTFTRDGRTFATGGHDSRVRLWDVASWTEIRPVEGHIGPVQALAFTPDGKTVISGGLDQSARFWDWPAGLEARRIDGIGTHWGISTLVPSPDGKSVVTSEIGVDHTGPYRRWDVATGKELTRFGVSRGGTAALAYSNDGKTLITGLWTGALAMFDAETGRFLREVGKINGQIIVVAPTPDGHAAVWAKDHQGIGLRELTTGAERHSFPGSRHSTTIGLGMSADGRLLVAADGNQPVHLWDVNTGRVLAEWQSKVRGVRSAAISRDGRVVALAGYEGVALWDVLTQRESPVLSGHLGDVRTVAFSSNGTALATGGADGIVMVWDLTGRLKDGKLPALALKPDELEACWRDLMIDEPRPANRAVWSLAASASTAVPFLEKRVKPIALVDTERLVDLIAKLSHESFVERERASRELGAFGEAADEALRRALEARRDAETVRRIELLLKDLNSPVPSGERRRQARAVAALEYAGDASAMRLLEALADGMPNARLTNEARAALARVRASRAR